MTRGQTGETLKTNPLQGPYLHKHLSILIVQCEEEYDCRGHAFFADQRGVREFEEKFETLGPLMFGLADGQSEAPKIMAKKVKRNKYISTAGLRWSQILIHR